MATNVQPPVRTPYRYGLLSAGQVVEHGDSLRLQSDYQFDSTACASGLIWDADCAATNLPKTVTEGIQNQTASPFMVISGISCTLIAGDIDDAGREAFESQEQRLVEQGFWSQLRASSPTILGGGAVNLVKGVALLEEFLRDNTGFTGMLHSDAYVAPYATNQVLVTEENPETTKRTGLWTPWVFGGGYVRATGPVGQPAPTADQAYIFATGQVVIHRGNIRQFGGRDGGFNVTTNQTLTIVERPYVVIPDCPIAAVLVNLEPAA